MATKNIVNSLNSFAQVALGELNFLMRDSGVMLILLGAIFIYSTLYSLIYFNQIVREVPVAVVDLNQTSYSREYLRALDISPNVKIDYNAESLDEAKHLFFNRKVYGIVLIPQDFEKNVMDGAQASVSIYADASYFLMYKQVYAAAVKCTGYQNIKIETARFMARGMSQKEALALAEPVQTPVVKLYNRVEGYATFVMPAIMILILQQILLIGIGIVGGSFNEKKLWGRYSKGSKLSSSLLVMLGKASAYFFFAGVIAFVVFGAFYKLFDYPTRGAELQIILFFVPYVLSVVFMALGISTLFKYRETSIITLVAWSIPFLLFSGVSFPQEGMPAWLYGMGQILPSSSAITSFIRLQVMGGSLTDIMGEYLFMWGLALFYFGFAALMMHLKFRKLNRELFPPKDAKLADTNTLDEAERS